jgi:hypothetical protein
MKAFVLAVVLLGLSSQAFAATQDEQSELLENEARFLYYNGSSTAAAITLLGALILLGVIAYLIYVGGVLSTQGSSGYNRHGVEQQYDPSDYYGQQYRSAQDGYDFNSLNVIQWISMLQDLYEKFDYNDLDCQKRLICEVMREPEYYGNVAQKFKSGFQYAKYLEVLSLPDDMRELLDEYLDANARAEQNKACEEFFQCPYSIKESMKKNTDGNSL